MPPTDPDGARRRRRRLIVPIVGGLGVLAIAVIVALSAGGDPPPDAAPAVPEDASPQELADRACEYLLTELPRQVREDAPADQVRGDVARADRQAAAAASEDVRWVPLASGVAALRVALEEDDPGAADVAIDVITAECER